MKNKKIIIIFILGIILYGIIQFFWIYNTPLSGDGSYHTEFFRQNFNNHTITYLDEYLYGHYGFPRVQQFTLNYPPLYHTLGGILYGLFGTKTVYIMDALFGLVIILSFSLFFKNKKLFFVIFSLLLLNSGFYVSGGNNNIILALTILLTIISVYKYTQTKNIKYLILFVLFSIFGFGTKQLFYFVYPFLYLFIFFIAIKNKHLYKIIIGTLVIILGISPMLYWQIKNTGTLSTQTIEGWPIIDKYIFKPRHFQIEQWQKEIDKVVDIKRLNQESATHYYKINKGLNNIDFSFFNNLLFNTYSTLPASLKLHKELINIIILLFIVLGLYKLYFKNKKLFYILFLGVVGGLIPYKFTSRIEYSLIISLILLFYWIFFISSLKNNQKKYIIISFLFVLFFTNTIKYINIQKFFWDNTYSRVKMNNSNSLNELLSYLNTSSIDRTKLVLHSNSQEFPFQSHLKTFWDYRLNFLNEKEFKKYLPYYENKGWKYVLIFKKSIKKNFTNWGDILGNSYLYQSLKNENGFKKLYENEDFIFYELSESKNNINLK